MRKLLLIFLISASLLSIARAEEPTWQPIEQERLWGGWSSGEASLIGVGGAVLTKRLAYKLTDLTGVGAGMEDEITVLTPVAFKIISEYLHKKGTGTARWADVGWTGLAAFVTNRIDGYKPATKPHASITPNTDGSIGATLAFNFF